MTHPDFLTVTLNPTLDISTSVPQMIDQVKLRCGAELEQVGGGGVNVAHVIHSLGGHCQAMLPVGGTRGQEILKQLRAAGLRCVTTAIEQSNRQCLTVYEQQSGREYRFVLPGPTLSAAEQNACIQTVLEHLPRQFLVLSGSLPQGVADDFYARMIGAVKQTAPELPIVVDTSGPALANALEAGVFLFKPSREEFFELTGHQPVEPRDCIEACRRLIAQGKTQLVALTLGAHGALIVSDRQAWRIEPLAVNVTSTVGAGDSFVGGLLWSLAQSGDLNQAARVATAAAAAALQTQGALTFERDPILAMSQNVVTEALVGASQV